MSKKITVSVPDDLHQKMTEWRESFNFSKIFQKAVSTMIQRKEEFQKRLRSSVDMAAIAERLRREKLESQTESSEQGKKEGVKWARSAHYKELQYALRWLPEKDPQRNEILGDYFSDLFAANHDLQPNTPEGKLASSEYVETFLSGWKEGVEAFWNEIKDKL
jgi:metal-responsive CopG/Arc/MetJ family transcriptional regulator